MRWSHDDQWSVWFYCDECERWTDPRCLMNLLIYLHLPAPWPAEGGFTIPFRMILESYHIILVRLPTWWYQYIIFMKQVNTKHNITHRYAFQINFFGYFCQFMKCKILI